MEKIYETIKELKNEMNDATIDMVCNYYDTDMYISDAISEQADNMVDIYREDLMEWANGNIHTIEEAVNELGYPGDFLRMIQQGQYYYYEREIYDNQEMIAPLAALLMLRDDVEDGLELTDDQIEDIMDNIDKDGVYDYDRFDQIAEDLEQAIESVLDHE